MKRKILLVLCIIMFSITINTYAADTIYSLNKYSEEKFETIIESYNEENKQDGFIAAGQVLLKEKYTVDNEEYSDYQVALVKYDVTGKVKWIFTYGKNNIDKIDSLTYIYDEENKVNGYLITMKKSTDIKEQTENVSVFVKVDINGKLIEEKTAALKENSIIKKIIPVVDQNYMLHSYIAIGQNEETNYPFIAKYDTNLNLVYEKSYELTNTEFKDIAVIRNENTLDSYAISITENNEKIINKVNRYDFDGNELSTITSNENINDNISFLETKNGIIIYGLTNEVKLPEEDASSYYIINYNINNELVWETVGNISVDKNEELKLMNNLNEYLIMYTNNTDKSNEIVKINIEGLIESKVKKIKNDYYDITNFNIYNNTIYFIGQIKCPEDETCDYDSNSLFLISDQDKVIEVKQKDASSISIVTILFIISMMLIVIVRKKTNVKQKGN